MCFALKINKAIWIILEICILTGHGSHKSTVICLDCHPDNNLIMSGSTDVTANIVNVNTGKVGNSILT